jgi:hypothetical protein
MVRRRNYSSDGRTAPKSTGWDDSSDSISLGGFNTPHNYVYMDNAPVSRQMVKERQRGFCPTGNVTCFDCNDSQRQKDNIRCIVCEWRHSQRINAR